MYPATSYEVRGNKHQMKREHATFKTKQQHHIDAIPILPTIINLFVE